MFLIIKFFYLAVVDQLGVVEVVEVVQEESEDLNKN
jgi:hypothetical protein